LVAEKSPAATAAVKPSAVSTKDLVFHAPDPALLPVFSPPPAEAQSEGTVRRRSRANRPTLSPEEKKAKAAAEASTPQKVRGSTRLEAKRQRRRDGRDGGRRRQSVTESEFLARRESVDRVMVVRERTDRTQIAVLEDNVVVEHYVARAEESSLIGNVYMGRCKTSCRVWKPLSSTSVGEETLSFIRVRWIGKRQARANLVREKLNSP